MKNRRWIFPALSLAVLTAVFFFSSRQRLVDPDEGAYMLAAKLVMQGKLLYSDFFWPQMPLLPYAYGLWMKIVGTNWHTARYFSGLLGVGMGLLLFFYVRRLAGKQAMGLLAVLLFAAGSFSVGWFATTKTYALSTFLLFAAYLSLQASGLKNWKHLLAGALLGLAICTRLYFIGMIPVFLYWTYREEKSFPSLAGHALGLLLGLLPAFYFLLKSPDNFYFNNIGYHFLRSDYNFGSSLVQKLSSIPRLLGWGLTEGFIGAQFGFLVLVNALFFFNRVRARKPLPGSLVMALFLPVMLFVPTPTHIQYFSSMLPFLLVNLTMFLQPHFAKPGAWRPLWGLAAAAYVLVWPLDYYRYTSLGSSVPGVGGGPENAENWKIETLESVARAVDSHITSAGEPVLAFWPGCLLSSKASLLPKMENHSGVVISPRLDEADREKYRIVSIPDMAAAIAGHKTRLIVFEVWIREPLRSRLLEWMAQSGYRRIEQIGGREIYQWNPGG